MKLSKTLLRVAENAIKVKHGLVPLNKSWQFFHAEYAIGLAQGTKLKLTEQDRAKLQEMIRLEEGINLQQTSVADFANMHREQALEHGTDEKLAGKKVKDQRLAFKTLAEQPLKINQQHYYLPANGHMDMCLDQLESIEHNCILIIENYRCFDQLQQIKLKLPAQYNQPLVVYRGDNYYSEKTLRLLLQLTALPVIAMLDIDLKSLLIASSLPRAIGLMSASLPEFEVLLQEKGNAKLYAKQLPACQQALNASDEPVIKALWALLRKRQKVWVQEHDLGATHALELMAFVGVR
ncbi:MAG: hypothetical protein RQ733_06530 [Methyloprofundus sp.]|nr:hypothetical protein [Methyloprofundus sp.]MDT8425611.1 hypothetical protein [Methyloprofundus sp.]